MKAVPAIEGRFQASVRHGRRWFTPLSGTTSHGHCGVGYPIENRLTDPRRYVLEIQRMAARQSRATTSLKPQLLPLLFTDHKSGSTYGSARRHRQSTAWPS
jgi:hypothetical protein